MLHTFTNTETREILFFYPFFLVNKTNPKLEIFFLVLWVDGRWQKRSKPARTNKEKNEERFEDCYLFNRQDESNLFWMFSQKNLTKTSVAEIVYK